MKFSIITKSILLFILILCNMNYTFSQSKKLKSEVSLDQKIGQMIMVGFRGLEIDENSKIWKDIKQYHLTGVVLFDYDQPSKSPVRNIQSAEQVKKLCISLKKIIPEIPFLIAIDQEGGRVCRLKTKFGFPSTVSAQYLGKLDDLDSTKKYAESNAKLLADLGINLNFAPCVDLNTNPENPVIGKIERSFSADPSIVQKHITEIIKIHSKNKVFSTLKHFPGHGSSKDDSHQGFVDVSDTWQLIELEPYSEMIKLGLCNVIMTAHIFNSKLDPKYPATLSKNILTGILRDSLKFNGVIVSDDMQMKAIADHYGLETAILKSIEAGVDIVIFANNTFSYDEDIASKAFTIIKQLVNDGKISKKRIDESYNRIQKLKTGI